MAAVENSLSRRGFFGLGPVTLSAFSGVSSSCRPADEARRFGLDAREFGALFDGRTDDTLAIQRAIDEAWKQRRPLVLPSGIGRISQPLDLKGRYIAIVGSPNNATTLMPLNKVRCIIDAFDASEVIDSPLFVHSLRLDGYGLAEAGLRLRFRHRSVLDSLEVTRCDTGVEELDTWLSRRINCRVRTTRVGWQLEGSNHSSVWIGCSFIDATEVHLDVRGDGTANDGNNAILFQACDIEFGSGIGARIAKGTSVTFDTCYLGENIEGDVIYNAGKVLVRGGVVFVGFNRKHLGFAMASGQVTVFAASVFGQEFGSISRLVGRRATAGAPAGTATFIDTKMQLPIGGDQVVDGDVLGSLPMRAYAHSNGRSWRMKNNNATAEELTNSNERSVVCVSNTGNNSFIGLESPLIRTSDSRIGEPGYFIIVYSATRTLELRASQGSDSAGPTLFIGSLPASVGVQTYVKVDVPVDLSKFKFVELIMSARPKDRFTLFHATVSDSGILKPFPLANLGKAR